MKKYSFPSQIHMDSIHIEKPLRRKYKQETNDLLDAIKILLAIAVVALFTKFVVDPIFALTF